MPKTGKRSFRRKNKRTMRKNMKGGSLSNFTLMGNDANIKIAKKFKVSATDNDLAVLVPNIYVIVDDGSLGNFDFDALRKDAASTAVNDAAGSAIDVNSADELITAVTNALAV